MNRKTRKLNFIRTKNCYRKFGISLDSSNSITVKGRTLSFTFKDVVRERNGCMVFTNEFYSKLIGYR